jgi:hypothetical protein
MTTEEPMHEFDEKCLHCAINYAIGWWAKKNSAISFTDAAGQPSFKLNVSEVIPKISEVVGELVYMRLAKEHHATFEKYAHKCIDDAFERQRRHKRSAFQS